MPLRDPFARRIALIQAFMEVPPFRALELSRPPDLELLVRKVLARMSDDSDDPHTWVYHATAFRGYRSFFDDVLRAVVDDVERARADAVAMGMELLEPPELEPGIPGDEEQPARWAKQVSDHLSLVGDALPEEAGSLVLVLEPDASGDRRALGWAVGALAWYVTSERTKLIVLDGGEDPLVPTDGGVEDRLVRLDFAVPPQELEEQVRSDLEAETTGPVEARRLRLLAGAFATSAGRFDEAEARLGEALAGAQEAGARGEEANVLYNLGNLHLRTGTFEEASEALTRAASAALETENHGLGAMALTNLGVALHREGRAPEALETFGAARTLFRALNHRPGEAHVVDCLAKAWAPSDPERAAALWREAADLYDSIEAPHLQEVRRAGREDVLAKMESLGASG